MKKFVQRITDLCSENKRVAMFIDMDGTINEYIVFSENTVVKKMEDNYIYISPLSTVLKELEEIGNISNIDLYILSLSRTKNLTQIKKEWLKKYVSFIPDYSAIEVDLANKSKAELKDLMQFIEVNTITEITPQKIKINNKKAVNPQKSDEIIIEENVA